MFQVLEPQREIYVQVDGTLRTALAFLANPCSLRRSERLEDRQTVLRLTFADKLAYARDGGFRTANLALPFKMINGFRGDEGEMARLSGDLSNQIFTELAQWEQVLKDTSLARPAPPSP